MTNRFYGEALEQVSREHPFLCVCGKLCTGLHESHCAKFRKAVESRARKLEKQHERTKKHAE